jgi:hypothetical protein
MSQKEYSIIHKEKLLERSRLDYANHREVRKNRIQQYGKMPRGRYASYKTRSKRDVISFNITFEEFADIITRPCIYCGEIILPRGLDRINNEGGYEPDNVAPCCAMCNYMKQEYTAEDFKAQIYKIANYIKAQNE